MQQPPDDPWIEAFLLALAAGSVVTWIYLFSLWLRRGRILPYEPRKLVPWGPIAGMLAVVFVLVALTAAVTAGVPEPPPAIPSPLQAAERILGLMMFELAVTGAALALVVLFSSANLHDLGLPVYVSELLRDVRIGVVGCLAAIAPVYGLLVLARYVLNQLEEPPHHPLVEMVFRDPYFGVVLLASLAAVVVAPICEEIVFRLLLQGWLEKWEDALLGWRENESHDEARMTNDEERISDNSSFVIRHSSFSLDQPPSRGVAGLPYGWVPIVISALLFALAHFGYGPEPVPLFFLALVLGYLYQRTHRIIPCIVTHALFNLVTVITLWRLVNLSPE